MRMHRPTHPGCFIREEIIEPLQLTVSAAARVLGVSRPAVSNLLNGHADLRRHGHATREGLGVSMDTLLRMQLSHDIAQARQRERQIKVKPRSAPSPDVAA